MKRFKIDINHYQSQEQALEDLYSIVNLPKHESFDISTFKKDMEGITEDIVIELVQKSTISDDLVQIVDAFEGIQRENDHVFLIISIQ